DVVDCRQVAIYFREAVSFDHGSGHRTPPASRLIRSSACTKVRCRYPDTVFPAGFFAPATGVPVIVNERNIVSAMIICSFYFLVRGRSPPEPFPSYRGASQGRSRETQVPAGSASPAFSGREWP